MHVDDSEAQAIRRSLDFLRQVFNLPDPVDPALQKICRQPAVPVVDINQAAWPDVRHRLFRVNTGTAGLNFALINENDPVTGTAPDATGFRPFHKIPGPGWVTVVQELSLTLTGGATEASLFLTLAYPDFSVDVPIRGWRSAAATITQYFSQGFVNPPPGAISADPALLHRPLIVVPFGFQLAASSAGGGAGGSNVSTWYVQDIPPGLSLPY